MTKIIFSALTIFIWCSAATFLLDNASLSPPLAKQTAFYGPYKWLPEGRTMIRNGTVPLLITYGHAALKEGVKPVFIPSGLLEWATPSPSAGRLFATDLRDRPFVTERQIKQDAGLRLHLGPLRFNWTFLFWMFLSTLFYFWIITDPDYVLSPQERWRRDEYFRQKVRDLEIDYKNKPQELRTRTVLLAFLGYTVVFGSIAAMSVVGFGLANSIDTLTPAGKAIATLLGLIPAWFSLKLARSLMAARGGDSGVRLQPKDAPVLFSLLDKICRKAEGPPFDRIFINMEMNASVSRHTGLKGFFGFGPVTLTLGLPLMQALTEEQLAAVIGHEYGHVAAKDNALGQWIYRIRNSWVYLGDSLRTEHLWYVLRLNRFYLWFIGIFNAYSFTLSRQCEYEADAFAARMTSAQYIAEALIAMEVRAVDMQKNFWDGVWKKSESLPEPAGTPYQDLQGFFKQHEDISGKMKGLEKAVTGHDSTHPALPDRVAALGRGIAAPEALKTSAAEKLLGTPLEMQLAILFDRSWRQHSRKSWKKKHNEYQSALKMLAAFQGRKISSLSRDDLSQVVSAAHLVQDDKKIMAACNEILQREPDNMAAKAYLLGFQLVHNGDETALLKLDDLSREHPEHTPTACRFAIRYLQQQERLEEAKIYHFRLEEWNYNNQAAEEERKAVYTTDVFFPHNIKQEYISKLNDFFRQNPVIGAAWMVRKEVKYMKETPLFVIGLKTGFWRLKGSKTTAREMKQVMAPSTSHFPPFFRFFWVHDVKGLEARLKKVKGSKIYSR